MSREVMQQVLDALEGIHPGNMTPMAEEYWNKAIAALREELAKPEQEPVSDEQLRKMHHEDQFGLFCDYDEFEQIVRAIENLQAASRNK